MGTFLILLLTGLEPLRDGCRSAESETENANLNPQKSQEKKQNDDIYLRPCTESVDTSSLPGRFSRACSSGSNQ